MCSLMKTNEFNYGNKILTKCHMNSLDLIENNKNDINDSLSKSNFFSIT